ncbi:sulfocyanin [Metallosphaera hakonensis]|uniref:Sulfocyanin n=1 Tax=Metallosphaera hakonensis JCM 8857 = DSM 7519 TaxID=1293036 RepID=A0A2U9ISV0_9CREN|nr:sulfocyanin [Metallosphaera hakonensis]AWR99106.1 sulfocyanin [Metallosphaera hakonensis JCM 8857 = DSM 7519]
MKKAVSPVFSYVVAFIVAIVVLSAAIISIVQFHTLSSPSTSNTTTTSGPTKVTLPVIASNKTVVISLVALSSASTFNFNGTSFGQMTIYVPAGYSLELKFTNQESLQHNLLLVMNDTPTPNAADLSSDGKILLFVGTSSSAYTIQGISSGQTAVGVYGPINPGTYWLACGISGHAESGMWVNLVVSQNVTTPYVVS